MKELLPGCACSKLVCVGQWSTNVLKLQVTDPEMLRGAVQGANLEVCQISKCPAPSRIARLTCPNARFDFLSLGPALFSTGLMPQDCFTFMFVVACPEKGHSLNFEMEHTDGYLGFFPPGGPLDAITPAGYAGAALTLPSAVFHDALAHQFTDIPDGVLALGAGLRVGPVAQTRLRTLLAQVEDAIWNGEGALSSPLALGQLQSDLVSVFLGALRSGCENLFQPDRPRLLDRQRRLRQLRDYIAGHAHEPIHLEDLCAAVGLSKRSVEYLFREFLGISPIAYLRHQRLHVCHRALWKATPGRGEVKRVALECGFWHFGHFTSDYKALFGEMPSETLARANR